jgi:Spy/CpxP family protein refolding chaperone
MSFNRKLITAATSALAVVAFTTFASAQDTNTNQENNSTQKQEMREGRGGRGFGRRGGDRGMRGGRHGGDKMMLRALGQLNLSDAQKEQIRGISETFKTSTQTQREELRSLGMKKRDGIITTDEQARFKEIRTQIKASGEQMRNQVLAVLTAEQRTRLEQMKEEMKRRKMERRQNRQNQTAPQTEVN